jgi:tRNA threonylcarbamoyladenosine biosynthesis protein TsaE
MLNKTYELAEINEVADEIIKASEINLFAFEGDLGAGKTTLIKAMINAIGIENQGSSPSFSLINVYENNEQRVYHCDLYRLNTYEEALDIGFEDYLTDEESWCFIEWPEVVEFLLPHPYHLIKLHVDENNKHSIKMIKVK